MLRHWAIGLFLSISLAGCSGGSDGNPFADGARTFIDIENRTLLYRDDPLLVASFDGTFSSMVEHEVTADLTDDPAPAQPGGGTDHTADFENLSFQVKLQEPAPGHRLQLFLVPTATAPVGVNATMDLFAADGVERRTADAGDTITVDAAGPGSWSIFAIVGEGEEAVHLVTPVQVSVSGTITMTGTVWPLRPNGTPAPANYNDMRDIIWFEMATTPTSVAASTAWAGGTLDLGTDVDLGLVTPAGESIGCIGTGGGAVPFVPYDPAQSAEATSWPEAGEGTGSAGQWGVIIGAMPDGCGGFASWYYHNLGAVPYSIEITLR